MTIYSCYFSYWSSEAPLYFLLFTFHATSIYSAICIIACEESNYSFDALSIIYTYRIIFCFVYYQYRSTQGAFVRISLYAIYLCLLRFYRRDSIEFVCLFPSSTWTNSHGDRMASLMGLSNSPSRPRRSDNSAYIGRILYTDLL